VLNTFEPHILQKEGSFFFRDEMNYKELEELVWRLSKVAKDAYAE
jgi:hypothetical protein